MSTPIRALIVDDEALIRERFRYGFPLAEHGYEIVGEAEDGEEALALCERVRVDIVITDIVMPRMDGLELTQRLTARWPHIKVVILSNYQEFEFARQAVAYGAIGYMLKVKSGYQELLALLDKARLEIEAEREKISAEHTARRQHHRNLPVLRQHFLRELLDGQYDRDDRIAEQCAYLRLRAPGSATLFALMRIQRGAQAKSLFSAKDWALLQYALIQMAEETAEKTGPCGVLPLDDRRFLLLCGLDPQQAGRLDPLKPMRDIFRAIAANVERYLPFTVAIAAERRPRPTTGGTPAGNTLVLSLRAAWNVLQEADKAMFYDSDARLCFIDEAARFAKLDGAMKERLYRELSDLPGGGPERSHREAGGDGAAKERTQAGGPEAPWLEARVRERLSLFRERSIDPEELLNWLGELTAAWLRYDPGLKERMAERLRFVESLADAEAHVVQLLKSRENRPLSLAAEPVREEIRQALTYISTHYAEPLSLAQVCHRAGMSPNYFSVLFKKQTGLNFSDYLTMYRIEQAKLLLTETSLQVQDIAERVGIPDYKYFAKLFRKSSGLSPSDYRRGGNGGGLPAFPQ